MSRIKRFVVMISLVLTLSGHSFCQVTVRVATYNIEHLKSTVGQQGNRLQKLKQVIQLLDADVIGLEEIDNRAALEKVFEPAKWCLIIDDDSGDDQDVALAVRKPFSVNGFSSAVLDADDQHFLFSGPANNIPFPNRRDLLCVEVNVPNTTSKFFVMVHHAKSRFENGSNK